MHFNHAKLNQILRSRSIDQKELAEAVVVSESAVSGWCRGIKIPSFEAAARIAKFLCISMDELAIDYTDGDLQDVF